MLLLVSIFIVPMDVPVCPSDGHLSFMMDILVWGCHAYIDVSIPIQGFCGLNFPLSLNKYLANEIAK